MTPRRYLTPEQQRDVLAGIAAAERELVEWQGEHVRDTSRTEARPEASPPIVVERWSEFRDSTAAGDVEYAIDGVAQKGGVGFIAGGPKTGKTWQGLHAAVAVSLGQPYLGRYRTTPQPVVYLALEGARANVRARIGALARGLGRDPDGSDLDQLHVVYKPRRLDLHDPASAASLVAAVADLSPGVVFVDVLRRAARIRESGDGVTDFTRMLEHLEPLTGTGWTVILLHHFRKWSEAAQGGDTGDRMSGSGSLFGSADFAVFIVKADRDQRRMDLEFVTRDGAQLGDATVHIHGIGTGPHGGFAYHDTATVQSTSDDDSATRRVASIDAAIVEWVKKHPGQARRVVREGVGGKTGDVETRLSALIRTGRIAVVKGPRNAKLHYLPELVPSLREPEGTSGAAE